MRSEFEFILNLKEKYGLNQIGDDCAVLPKDSKTDLLVTTDMLVEEIDFRMDWTTPKLLGMKAAAVSLSDIAAMGGTPKWALLTIGTTKQLWKSGAIDELFAGYQRMSEKFDVEIVGGDISRTKKHLVIDSIVGGEVPKRRAVLRSRAKPGDSIFVTGPLGGSGAGLHLLKHGARFKKAGGVGQEKLLTRHLNPLPRVREGEFLRELGVSAMIDISDGVSSDLGHICDASGVGAIVNVQDVPIDKHIGSLKLDVDSKLDLAMNSGEDYELLFTADEKKIPSRTLARFHRIGKVTERSGIIELSSDRGVRKLRRRGYRHF